MRLFVYEYCCASDNLSDALAQSLWAEGWAMLSAVLEDLQTIPGVEPCTILNERGLQARHHRALARVQVENDPAAFRELARTSDYSLVIAPELDGILLDLCQVVEETGGCLLGPSPYAVALTGDKLVLSRHLAENGVPTPPSSLCVPGMALPPVRVPAVVKPRHGAGSQATFLIEQAAEWKASLVEAVMEVGAGDLIVQPFVPGYAVSVAFLIGPRERIPLQPAVQRLSQDGRFHYRGGSLPLPASLAQRAIRAGRQAVQAVPGLRGYVGVDVVLGEAADGSQDWVMEINPRLTTSYIGLRQLAESNLAEAMLRVTSGQEISPLKWRKGEVTFSVDGEVSYTEPEAGGKDETRKLM